MRYAAPFDVSAIFLSSGPLTVDDGFIDVPNDAPQGDIGALAVNGFYPAPYLSPEAPPAVTKAKPAASADNTILDTPQT